MAYKIQGLHGSEDFIHDVLGLALGSDAQMPLCTLDVVAPHGLLSRLHVQACLLVIVQKS